MCALEKVRSAYRHERHREHGRTRHFWRYHWSQTCWRLVLAGGMCRLGWRWNELGLDTRTSTTGGVVAVAGGWTAKGLL